MHVSACLFTSHFVGCRGLRLRFAHLKRRASPLITTPSLTSFGSGSVVVASLSLAYHITTHSLIPKGMARSWWIALRAIKLALLAPFALLTVIKYIAI